MSNPFVVQRSDDGTSFVIKRELEQVFADAYLEADAKRIAACLNACHGVPTEVLEDVNSSERELLHHYVEAMRQLGECSGGFETLTKEVAALNATLDAERADHNERFDAACKQRDEALAMLSASAKSEPAEGATPMTPEWVKEGIASFIETNWPHDEYWPPEIAERIRAIEIRPPLSAQHRSTPAEQPAPAEGEVVITSDPAGRIVAVTRQDEDGRILSVLAESPAESGAVRSALADLVRVLRERHYGRMPDEVQRAFDAARAALAEQARPWDASQIKQPDWSHVMGAYIAGARDARANPDATDDDFKRAADAHTKLTFEAVDPVSEAALRTESWVAESGAVRLPPLPPAHAQIGKFLDDATDVFTAEQMQAYARAALAEQARPIAQTQEQDHPAERCGKAPEGLLLSLGRAIDAAEHKPGEWSETWREMGGICDPSPASPSGEQPKSWAHFSFKRDSWLAVAAVNALPQLMAALEGKAPAGEQP